MARLKFDEVAERTFEAGVSEGVLFPGAPNGTNKGVVWNGLTSVSDTPDGGDANDQYADNIKYLSLRGAENRNGTIEAFTYPEEFEPSMGNAVAGGVVVTGGTKDPFNFVYKTKYGNAEEGIDFGEKMHIVYNATVSPSERQYETINDSPEAMTLSWEFNTTPIPVTLTSATREALAEVSAKFSTIKQTAVLELVRTSDTAEFYDSIEALIYGTDGSGQTEGTEATLPLPGTILTMLAATL